MCITGTDLLIYIQIFPPLKSQKKAGRNVYQWVHQRLALPWSLNSGWSRVDAIVISYPPILSTLHGHRSAYLRIMGNDTVGNINSDH